MVSGRGFWLSLDPVDNALGFFISVFILLSKCDFTAETLFPMSFCDAVMSEANPLYWFARAVTRSTVVVILLFYQVYCC